MSMTQGTSFDVRNLDSIQPLFGPKDSTCGVYRLRFSDGDAYVGQSTSVVSRYASHRRRWGEDIVTFEFFPAEVSLLDDLERALITSTEQDTSIRNVLLAARPRGESTYDFEVAEGVTVSLPWERDERKTLLDEFTDREIKNWRALQTHEAFPLIISLLGWYVSELIPDPKRTVGRQWTLTCLPSTNRSKDHRRLAVLNCGNLETMVITENAVEGRKLGDGSYVGVFINTVPDDALTSLSGPDDEWWVEDHISYSIAETMTWCFDLVWLHHAISGEIDFSHLLDLMNTAYELNVQMMRHGGTMFTRFHNGILASEVLSEALWLQVMRGQEG